MRRDKQGHAWKWQGGSGYGFCPFCGVERKSVQRGPEGAKVEGFRRIGSGEAWSDVSPKCTDAVKLGAQLPGCPLGVFGVLLAWPPRFECRAQGGQKVIVPALAYWRARRSK